jgi:hypothetical protein
MAHVGCNVYGQLASEVRLVLCQEAFVMRRKHFVIALLLVAVTAGPAWAAHTKKVAVPGTDGLNIPDEYCYM